MCQKVKSLELQTSCEKKCRRNKLYCKMEREREIENERKREREREERESERERHR